MGMVIKAENDCVFVALCHINSSVIVIYVSRPMYANECGHLRVINKP